MTTAEREEPPSPTSAEAASASSAGAGAAEDVGDGGLRGARPLAADAAAAAADRILNAGFIRLFGKLFLDHVTFTHLARELGEKVQCSIRISESLLLPVTPRGAFHGRLYPRDRVVVQNGCFVTMVHFFHVVVRPVCVPRPSAKHIV